MKVSYDYTPMVRSSGGVLVFTQEITKRLEEKYEMQPIGFIDDNVKNAKLIKLPRRIYSLLYKYTPLLAPSASADSEVSLFYNMVAFPKVSGSKKIVIVHDVAYLDTPEAVQPKNRAYLSKFVPKSVDVADVVICVSEFTRKRVLEEYNVLPEKVKVVPNGVNVDEFNKSGEVNLEKIYKIPKNDYLLFLATLEPRKNLLELLEAYQQTSKKTALKPLVLAGGRGWYGSEFDAKVNELKNNGLEVYLPGRIEEEHKVQLYKNAFAFVFPSVYEGFGIPIIEAMASGLPIVASNIEPHMELLSQENAFTFDPSNTEELSDVLIKLHTSSKQKLDNMSKANQKRAQQYTWDTAAAKFASIIDELAQS